MIILSKVHTFVICAYKESKFLEQCIISCLNQESVSKGQSEVIIYTSTSNMYITNLADKYDIKLYSGKGFGIGNDWNQALSCVKTKYATIAHQDDIYLKKFGSNVLNAFKEKNELNIVFTDYEENDEFGVIKKRNINLFIKTLGLNILTLFNNKKFQRRIYAFGNFICCPAVSYNLERLNDFRFNENFKMVLDWDAWERIMRKEGTIYFVKKRLMIHRIHNESETTLNTRDHNREKEELIMFNRYWPPFFAKIMMKIYVYNQKSNK